MTAAIRVSDLGKSYRVQHANQGVGYSTLRESLVDMVKTPMNLLGGRKAASSTEEFWALKDVNFEVQPGEVVGIIGRNGAGKSTLLKILSRITKPSSGRVEINGRVGSLLEVGSGFHPELTGRENIYLNGSVLGMSRREIAQRFDEIVAFAEVEKFLDTPVKRYSSGMYVRLAFAVAAHLDPEILVVDEVLAVGDQNFQKKCLGKLGQVSRSGRTVLFVSHNIATVEALCTHCILLEKGRVKLDGETATVLSHYHSEDVDHDDGWCDLRLHQGRVNKIHSLMKHVVLGDGMGEYISKFRMGSPLTVKVDFDLGDQSLSPVLAVTIKTSLGSMIFGVNNRVIGGFEFDRRSGTGTMTCRIDRLPLMPGIYTMNLYFGDEHVDLDVIEDAIGFEVFPTDVYGTGKLPHPGAGPICWPATWELESLEKAISQGKWVPSL